MSGNGVEGTFHRVEKKYIINKDQFENIISILPEYMQLDDYSGTGGLYNIRSLYYDTPDNAFIRETLANKGYKEKIRIRAYGDPGPNDMVYLEIKKKIMGTGNKRRFKMTLLEAYGFMESGFLDNTYEKGNTQVLREIQAIKERYGSLQPVAVIGYDRLAFNGLEDTGLRISFDTHVCGRTYDLMLESGGYGDYLIEPENVVMEVKGLFSLPLWLTRMLSTHEVFPGRCSKYKMIYSKILSEKGVVHV